MLRYIKIGLILFKFWTGTHLLLICNIKLKNFVLLIQSVNELALTKPMKHPT